MISTAVMFYHQFLGMKQFGLNLGIGTNLVREVSCLIMKSPTGLPITN